ncbi:MAG TPA: hypothetical protein VFQ00_12235 [Terriglobales bacterium]|nr:hypothetical protein [Terriglobales bacterium]
MRSDLVHEANAQIKNRFLLCGTLVSWSRRAHQTGSLSSTINSGLALVAGRRQAVQDPLSHLPHSMKKPQASVKIAAFHFQQLS